MLKESTEEGLVFSGSFQVLEGMFLERSHTASFRSKTRFISSEAHSEAVAAHHNICAVPSNLRNFRCHLFLHHHDFGAKPWVFPRVRLFLERFILHGGATFPRKTTRTAQYLARMLFECQDR